MNKRNRVKYVHEGMLYNLRMSKYVLSAHAQTVIAERSIKL